MACLERRGGGPRVRLLRGRAANRDVHARGRRPHRQLPVRLHPGLWICSDLHWNGRDHRPLPRAQGPQARPQVGRPVHRLHRRDRRGRHAPGQPRRRLPRPFTAPSIHDFCFYGPNGALTSTGDLVLETRAWRERLFLSRAPIPISPYPPFIHRLGGTVNRCSPACRGGGRRRLALNQLLVVMDGIGNPPFLSDLHELAQHVPRRDVHDPAPHRAARMRVRPAPPANEQIYFIGACNVRSRCSTRRSPARAAWAATSGSARRPNRTASTSSTSTSRVAHEDDLDDRAAATSSRASRTATRRR